MNQRHHSSFVLSPKLCHFSETSAANFVYHSVGAARLRFFAGVPRKQVAPMVLDCRGRLASSNAESGSSPCLKQWGRVWAIGFVLWTVLAFLSAAGAHVYTASMGSPESWAQLLAWNITISFVWSLLTPPVYALARRFTFDRSNWKTGAAPASRRQHRPDISRRLAHRLARAVRDLDAGSPRAVPGAHALARVHGLPALLVHPADHAGDRLLRQISRARAGIVAAGGAAGATRSWKC